MRVWRESRGSREWREWFRTSFVASVLLVLLGGLAWGSGHPFLFPSLGPTAYLLAARPDEPESQPWNVVGGHVVGIVAGLAAFNAVAPGLALTDPSPAFSFDALRLAASGVFSVALTTAGMLATDYRHAPACATTLIVSLGLLPSPADGAVVALAVVLLVGVQRVLILLESVPPAPAILSPGHRLDDGDD